MRILRDNSIMATPSTSATLGFSAEQQMQLFQLQLDQMKEKHTLEMEVLRAGLKTPGVERSEPEGENKPQVLEVSKSLPGVPRSLLSSILDAKLDPYNLYRLRAMHADDSSDARQRFSVDSNGEFQLEKAKGKLKDFGTTSAIWLQTFLNYTIAIIIFFGAAHPHLAAAILGFVQRITELNKVYIWSEAVLPLALTHHSDVMAAGQTESAAWTIPQILIDKLCRPDTVRGRQSSTVSTAKRRANTMASPSICDNWNQGKCTYIGCKRKHECSACNGPHIVSKCTKPK